jgi:hypothetical protein
METKMSYRQLYACATAFMLAMVASLGLLFYAMDVISFPDPESVAVEYNRSVHVHGPAHVADAERP